MTDSLDRVIKVDITVQDKAPGRKSFGIPMYIAHHTVGGDRVMEFSDTDEMLDAGFSTTGVNSVAYQMAQVGRSQDPKPRSFKVGKIVTPPTQIVHLIPTITTPGYVYKGSINGQAFSRANGASETVQSIVEAIQPLIHAFPGVSATEDNAKIVVTTDTPGIIVPYDIKPRSFRMLDATADPGMASELAAISDEDSNWYGFSQSVQSKAATLASAAWCESQKKLFFPQSCDWDLLDVSEIGDIGTALKALSYMRTAAIYHRKLGEFAGTAWLTNTLGYDAGRATAAFKTLPGVSADDLKTGELSSLETKRFTRYSEMGGANVTFEGYTPGGRFIDVAYFIDWLDAEVQADCYAPLLNNPKIGFDDSGLQLFKSIVENTLVKGQARLGIATNPRPVVSVPKVIETQFSDRVARRLRKLTFTARLTGALHGLDVEGTVTV